MNKVLDETLLNIVNIFDGQDDISSSAIESIGRVFSNYDRSSSQPCICILLERSSLYIASILGAWRAGFYVVPLNTAWPFEKNIDIINRIKPSLVLVEEDFSTDILQSNFMTRSSLKKASEDAVFANIEMRPLKSHDIAYVIFTSGSTGEPKGVVISAESFRAYIDWTRSFFWDYREIQKLLLTSELTFDITMGDIAFALAFGADIGVARHHTNIPSVLSMIMKYKIDLLYSVPTTHLALLRFAKQKRGADISSLKLIMSGGDRFPWQMVKGYSELTQGAHFFNVYGPTEVTINCFAVRLDDKVESLSAQNKPVPIGHCFNTLDFVLLSEGILTSTEGELCIVGSQIMMGYHGDSQKTSEVIDSDPRMKQVARRMYHTGDLAYIDDGLVYLRGRLDGLVKIKGYRIHPDEIAKAIDSLERVDSSAVIAVKFGDEHKLVAYVKLQKGFVESIDELSQLLIEKLPAYMIPSEYVFVDDFPVNQSGKIDKRKLKDSYK